MDSPSPLLRPDPPDLYEGFLTGKDLEAYRAAGGHVDLQQEIRLIRALIAQLGETGLLHHEVQLRLALAVLVRLTQAQAHGPGDEAGVASELLAMSDDIDRAFDTADAEGNGPWSDTP